MQTPVRSPLSLCRDAAGRLPSASCPEKILLRRSELMDYLADEPVELLVTLGAGDIDRFVGDIAQMLKDREP